MPGKGKGWERGASAALVLSSALVLGREKLHLSQSKNKDSNLPPSGKPVGNSPCHHEEQLRENKSYLAALCPCKPDRAIAGACRAQPGKPEGHTMDAARTPSSRNAAHTSVSGRITARRDLSTAHKTPQNYSSFRGQALAQLLTTYSSS